MVVVLDKDDDEEDHLEKSKIPATLDQALAAAFTHNSTNPNVAVLASASALVLAEASGSTHRWAQETRAEIISDSPSVEVTIPSTTTKRIPKPPRPVD